MALRRGECGPTEEQPPGALQNYQERRIVFEALTNTGKSVAQPTVATLVTTGRNDRGDPAIANVTLHAIACVREIPVGGSQIVLPGSLATEALTPPIAYDRFPLPPPLLPCDEITVGRGVSVPQWRVRFSDGTSDRQTVFVDGSTVLTLPADEVTIELLSPPLLLPPDPKGGETVLAEQGILVDAFANAVVEWGNRNSLPAAPSGMATWTNSQKTRTQGAPAAGVPILFERPPFARRVSIVADFLLYSGGAPVFVPEYVAGGTASLGVVPAGLVIAGVLTSESRGDVPALCTHVRVSWPVAPVAGLFIHCVWEIGV